MTSIKPIALAVFLLVSIGLFAQPNTHDKIKAKKVAFITEKLDFSSREAQQFWPFYNEREKKLATLKAQRKAELRLAKEQARNLSETDIENLVDGEFEYKQKVLDIKKEYHKKFKLTMPITKLAKLYRAEEDFTKWLIEQLRNRGKK